MEKKNKEQGIFSMHSGCQIFLWKELGTIKIGLLCAQMNVLALMRFGVKNSMNSTLCTKNPGEVGRSSEPEYFGKKLLMSKSGLECLLSSIRMPATEKVINNTLEQLNALIYALKLFNTLQKMKLLFATWHR